MGKLQAPKTTLPSGRAVPLMHLSTCDRPWEPVDLGNGVFVLARQKRGDASTVEHYRAAHHQPLLFDAEDAAALARQLNQGQPARRPRVHW